MGLFALGDGHAADGGLLYRAAPIPRDLRELLSPHLASSRRHAGMSGPRVPKPQIRIGSA